MKLSLVSSAIVMATFTSMPVVAEQQKTAQDLLAMFEKLSGKHPGMRKAHASGICATGTFTPNSALSQYSSSELFSVANVPATIRFSVGGGNPQADDRAPGARGMAIQLKLPSGSIHNIVGNSTPVFAAKNPDVFFGLLEALSPNSEGKVDMAKVGKYIAEHPSTQAAAHWQSTTMAPYSYASSEFYGLHTFYFENDDKELTKFRWHTKPDRGVRTLTKEEMAELPSKFLNDRLVSESQDGKISYTISVAIGKDEDTTNDPSQKWPDDREIMEFGKLILNSVGGDLCTPINFDPNVMSAGFKSSDDPVLRMRSPAYALSFGKRLSGQ